MIHVFLAGEGSTELGGWAKEIPYRSKAPGVLQALLEKVAPAGWVVRDAIVWKSIRKFRAPGSGREAEVQNVLGAALHAAEAGATVLAFSRDNDGDDRRAALVEKGIALAREQHQSLKIVGGVAVEEVEAWTLAAHGVKRAYDVRHPAQLFPKYGLKTDVASQVAVIQGAELVQLDALSLVQWLEAAREAFAPPTNDDTPVFLIGFMATGKTTVGGMLAKRLGWSFADLDKQIEERIKKSVSEIFASDGEETFRRYETEVLKSVAAKRRIVVATGGGTAANEENLTRMLECGRVVRLSITAEETVRRARGGKGRPLLEDSSDPIAAAAELLRLREPFYVRAHVSVDTVGRAPREVANEIVSRLGLSSKAEEES